MHKGHHQIQSPYHKSKKHNPRPHIQGHNPRSHIQEHNPRPQIKGKHSPDHNPSPHIQEHYPTLHPKITNLTIMHSFGVWLLLLCLLCQAPNRSSALTEKLLLVSFDGFRWDYLDFIPGLKHFAEVAKNGSSAEYMNNTFTTMTFATHHSMATGLYQENHGIVSNYMWDPVFREDFSPGCKPCLNQRWWGGEPIWITSTKQGKKTGCVFWPGTEVEFDGIKPAFVESYDQSVSFEERVDIVMDWFSYHDLDFGILYFHQPDKAGHKFGPRSEEVHEQVQHVNNVLGYLLESMRTRQLIDTVNVVIVSDHGLTNISHDRIIEVPKYVDMALLDKFVEVGAVCHVYPKEGQREIVYNQLKDAHEHMTVYKREDVPKHWHYSNNRRIGDILLVQDEHWACTENANYSWNFDLGNHGYDNRLMTMKPIFLAIGPDIKQGYRVKPFMALDIYPLSAALLNIQPSPNNGTLDIVKDILCESSPLSHAVRSPSQMNIASISMVMVLTLCHLLRILSTDG